MKTAEYRLEDGRHSLMAMVTHCGADVHVQVCGGEKHHIGALALAVPRPSLANAAKTSASVSVLCVTGHKDDELARTAAAAIAAATSRLVTVGVGIHVSHATGQDIRRLQNNFTRLLADVTAGLVNTGSYTTL